MSYQHHITLRIKRLLAAAARADRIGDSDAAYLIRRRANLWRATLHSPRLARAA